MDIMNIVTMVLTFLGSIPVVGHVLALIMPYILGIPLLISGLVAVWQGVVQFLQGLAKLPGLTSLQKLADTLKEDGDSVVSFENSFILPILNRLSVIPLPATPVTAPAPAAAVAPAPTAPAK